MWRVILTCRDSCPGFIDWEKANDAYHITGLSSHHERKIWIDAGLPLEEMRETVLHEWMHVACGYNIPLNMDQEEQFIGYTSRGLLHILEMHRLTLPRKPKGFTALAKHAREYNRRR